MLNNQFSTSKIIYKLYIICVHKKQQHQQQQQHKTTTKTQVHGYNIIRVLSNVHYNDRTVTKHNPTHANDDTRPTWFSDCIHWLCVKGLIIDPKVSAHLCINWWRILSLLSDVDEKCHSFEKV